MKYEGSTGKVWIGNASADVELGGATGSFDIDRADASVIAKAAHCPIRIGRMSHGVADLANAPGGIEVGLAEGTAVQVDADSTKGAVRVSVPERETGEEVKIHPRTRRYDIVIHPYSPTNNQSNRKS